VTRSLSYAAYGFLGLPLAMSALPVYVQIPAYYSTQLGMALVSVGWVLFLARFVDALQDPLLGYLIDRMRGTLTWWFCAAGFMLAIAFLGLWLPPVSGSHLIVWLALALILAYVAHSMLNIAYLAWGARIVSTGGRQSSALLGAAAWREAAGLVGGIAASVIPSFIISDSQSRAQHAEHLGWYCLAFAIILALSIAALLTAAPVWKRSRATADGESVGKGTARQWRILASNDAFKALLIPYFINAISVSIPATLVLFFINDRLQASQYSAAFLATYFISAAVGLPCWVKLVSSWGVALSWRLGMMLAIVAFISASMLSAGQIMPFFVICAASGFALGADLALPPVMLAQVIQADVPPAAYYGIWTLLGKFALAISGLALPVLASLNYHPGHPAGAELAWVYAGVPCGLKCIALFLLMRMVNIAESRTA